jgi:hypothetical protein
VLHAAYNLSLEWAVVELSFREQAYCFAKTRDTHELVSNHSYCSTLLILNTFKEICVRLLFNILRLKSIGTAVRSSSRETPRKVKYQIY